MTELQLAKILLSADGPWPQPQDWEAIERKWDRMGPEIQGRVRQRADRIFALMLMIPGESQ